MLNVSPSAQQRITAYFHNRTISAIRVIFDSGG
jgi:hypothetical protein